MAFSARCVQLMKPNRRANEFNESAFRLFAAADLTEGCAGHITARDPIDPECFWVNPFGVHFGLITPDKLLLLRDIRDTVAAETMQGSTTTLKSFPLRVLSDS